MSCDAAPIVAELSTRAEQARTWLLQSAAPLWSSRGRTRSGLFAEKMSLTREPDAAFFRTFVQARHIFSFVMIGKLGWVGPWRQLVGETMEVLIQSARRSDGFYVHRLDADAHPLDARADLYDQAFVLLALGTAGEALGRLDWFDEAEALLDELKRCWRHPSGGYREGEVVDPRVRRQNPHMHLLEAFLALQEASRREPFRDAALSIAELAQAKFIDQSSGALLEYFADDLQPAEGIEGRIAEPGHCFEWAWLLERLGTADSFRLSDRLVHFARLAGTDPERGIAINEVLTDGSVKDGKARLWPQTERLKAAVARHRRVGGAAEIGEALAAVDGLARYLAVPFEGLWRDKLKEDGSWVEEPAPGSSLYHISCAYAELAAWGKDQRARSLN